MAFAVRRVITGHDAEGRSKVLTDGASPAERRWPGSQDAVHWTSKGFPIDNAVAADVTGERDPDWTDGSVFRTISFDPHDRGEMHRTDSLDYVIVMSGSIDMDLDEGSVHLEAGDVLIQRGTAHRWANPSDEPCVVAFVMIGARPL